jgi:hypothetical protein
LKGEGNGIEGEIWGCLDGKERKIKKSGRERERGREVENEGREEEEGIWFGYRCGGKCCLRFFFYYYLIH